MMKLDIFWFIAMSIALFGIAGMILGYGGNVYAGILFFVFILYSTLFGNDKEVPGVRLI